MCWNGKQGESADSFAIDYFLLMEHESDSKDYNLYFRSMSRGVTDYMLNEEQCLKLYNALKKTLELENLI